MRFAILTNILTPYRTYFFDLIYEQMGKRDFRVFVMTDQLPLRPWNYSDMKRDYTELLKGKKVFIGGNDYLFSSNVNKSIMSFSPDVLVIAGSWTYPVVWKVMLSRRITSRTKTLFWTESHNHNGILSSTNTRESVRILKKQLMSRFDGFCLPGKYALETVSEMVDINNKSIIRLPNLIDNTYYDEANNMRVRKKNLRRIRGISDSEFVFFTPARMRDLKGQMPFFTNVVDAVKGKNVTFVLAGEGPDKEAIETIGKENGLRIQICDYQNQEQIREWYALSDAFLLPSLSDPNPLSNIEAAWAGLPLCISCYVGNGPELVEDGINGVVFDTLNKESVIEKISFVLNHDEAWHKNARIISHQKAENGFESKLESVQFINSLRRLGGKE